MRRVLGVLIMSLFFVSCENNNSMYKGATTYQKESYKTIRRAKYNQMKQEPKVALVIGNRDYEQDSLRYPIEDARRIKNFLESRGFTVIYDENVKTKGKLRTLVNRFISSIQQDGVGLFYFSGHGMNAYNENYIIPTNNRDIFDDRDVEDIGLSVNYLLKKLEDKHNRLNIVMLDACRNTLGKGASSSLSGVNSAEGVYIAYATGAGKRAKDDGLFASSFVENAKIKGLTVEEVFKNVRREVKEATGQTPFAYTGIVGDFYFTLPSVKQEKSKEPIKIVEKIVYVDRPRTQVLAPQPIVEAKVYSTKGIITSIDGLMYQNQPFTTRYTWKEAKGYCQGLTFGGYDNWRLPIRTELMNLGNIKLYNYDNSDNYDNWKKWFDKNKHKRLKGSQGKERFVREEFFDNMQTEDYPWFWTSESKDSSYAWRVRFDDGYDGWSLKTNQRYVVCVR